MNKVMVKQRVIKRLRELAQPDSIPYDQAAGICLEIAILFRYGCRPQNYARRILIYAFSALRPDNLIDDPLGTFYRSAYRWSGRYGKTRRKFAGQCADWLEANET